MDKIDCSKIKVVNTFFKLDFYSVVNKIREILRLKYCFYAGAYSQNEDVIYLNAKLLSKRNLTDDILCSIISHESLHMILTHFINGEASKGLDEFLKKTGIYNTGKFTNDGLS